MKLANIATEIFRSHNLGTKISNEDWQKLRSSFQKALEICDDAQEVQSVLEADVSDNLPIDLKSATYEKLLVLDGRKSDTLRKYANHLWLHGPDWDEIAEQLWQEAEAK